MKRNHTMVGWLARLTASAIVVLMSQHAFAVGTDAGTTISNQAQVDYAVGGAAQTFILSDPSGNSVPGGASGALPTDFVVDNRVDFTLVESGLIGHTPVTPGQNGEFVQFTLQNTGNETQDFRLVASNLLAAFGPVNGLTDTEVDMSNIVIYVDNNGDGLTTATDPAFVDELAPGDSVDIYVVADADITLANGDIANINLLARVADAGGATVLGGDTADDVGNADTATVDVVFAEGGALGDGTLEAQDGFTVSSAALTITKTATLISDPFNNTTNPKAIPGAVIEYVVTVSNATGGSTAEAVTITDALSADVTILNDLFGAAEVQIDNNGTVSTCTQEVDGDNCEVAAGTLSVGATGPAIDVVATGTLTITFRVTIN
jgi:uncharacterized repeat protein (TIGR01451 family)